MIVQPKFEVTLVTLVTLVLSKGFRGYIRGYIEVT